VRRQALAPEPRPSVAGGRNAATLPSGTPVTVRLIKPATVTIEE
jgi:hypothetical protein